MDPLDRKTCHRAHMELVRNAQDMLDAAVRLLDEGRDGASPEWIEAAELYLASCRTRLRRAQEGARSWTAGAGVGQLP